MTKNKIITLSAIIVSILYTFFWIMVTPSFNTDNKTAGVSSADTHNTSYLNSSANSSEITENSSLDISSDAASSDISSVNSNETTSSNTTGEPGGDIVVTNSDFTVGMWFSKFELSFKGCTEEQFKSKINTMFDNAKAVSVTDLYVHVRPSADAYYNSSLFPFSESFGGTQGAYPGYDPLQYMVEAAHNRGLKIHAWINPYRVATHNDLSKLADTNIAKVWLTDDNPDNDRNIIVHKTTTNKEYLYFNPAKTEVQRLIIDGVREILDNYDVDGIQIDDYFYPESGTFDDSADYAEYTANGGSLSFGDWRRANVSTLVQGIYSAVHSYQSKDLVFGISPSAHISTDKTDRNYTTKYADIMLWITNEGYCDYIAPQLYFGYDYPTNQFKFNNLLNQWSSLPRHESVEMIIGVAPYKIDKTQAKTNDGNEWQNDTKILSKQLSDVYNKELDGIALYSYSYICTYNGAKQHKASFIETANSLLRR